MKRSLSFCLSCVDIILRVKWIVVCPSVWQIPIWVMKCCLSVCLSAIRWFQYEGWNEMSVHLSYVDSNIKDRMNVVLLSGAYSNMRVKWNVLCASVLLVLQCFGKRNLVCPSVCLNWIQIWVVKWTAVFRLPDVDLIMEGEMKCNLSVLHGYKVWNGM